MTTSPWVMCIQDFVELLIIEIRKMSEKEKAEFRRAWIQASLKQRHEGTHQ
jgi:hypothetical protein